MTERPPLADLGANLYLNGMSAFFLAAHRRQRSLSLDLKKPEGLEIARRLRRAVPGGRRSRMP